VAVWELLNDKVNEYVCVIESTVEVDTTIFNLLLEIVTATFEFGNVIDWIAVGQVESETVNRVVKLYDVVDYDAPLFTEIAERVKGVYWQITIKKSDVYAVKINPVLTAASVKLH
jgi:hypothetical protein